MKKRRRVPGQGSLWRCRSCDIQHRDPAAHLWDFHHLVAVWHVVFETQELLSDARKETRPERLPTTLQAQTLF